MRGNLESNKEGKTRVGEHWVVIVLVLASLVIRTGLVRSDRVVRWDEPDYLILGRNLVTGQGYAVTSQPELHYAPLFPMITGLLYPVTHDMKLNSDFWYVTLGALTLVPFYWLARRLFGRRVATVGSLLLCLYPPLNAGVLYWGTMLEPLYLFLLCSALATAWMAWERRTVGAYGITGLLIGLAYLTKPEALVYLVVLLAFWAVGLWRAQRWRNGRAWLALLTSGLAFVLVISPYLGFLYRYTGRIMVTGKLGVTYVAGQGAVDRDPGLYDRALSRLDSKGEEIIWFSPERFNYDVMEYIRADPRAFARRVWQNINALERVLFARQVFPFYLLGVLALGWFGSAWNRARWAKEAYLLAGALPALIFLPFHIELRYFAPWMPLLMLWLAKGVEALGEWAEQSVRQPKLASARWQGVSMWVMSLLAAGLMFYFAIVTPRAAADGVAGLNWSRREAGLWLKENTPADALIMSRDTEVPFYAERRWTPTPNEEYERFIAYVRQRGARYVVVDEREVTVIRPQLDLLLDAASPPPGLRHLYTAPDPMGKTIVYEVEY